MSFFTQSQITVLKVMGFEQTTEYGQPVLRKDVVYSALPQDDIEDIMSDDDVIMGWDMVTVTVSLDDGSISLESGDAYVGPINADSDLAQKILASAA